MTDPAGVGLDAGALLELYRFLALTRAAEDRLRALAQDGLVGGTVRLSLGQEAGAVGAAYALDRRVDGTGDVLIPSERAAGAVLTFGGDLTDFFLQHTARADGPTAGRARGLGWSEPGLGLFGGVAPLGTTVEVMAGICLSFRLRGEDRVGLVFCGDGATSTGSWHEGLAFAAAQRCPMVVVVEANQWAVATPTAGNTRLESFTQKAQGYGIAAESVDGTDVVAVYGVVRNAVQAARAGGGVQLVELRYLRRGGNDVADPGDYMEEDVVRHWEGRDPLRRLRAFVLTKRVATEAQLAEIDADAVERCREAAEAALASAPPAGRSARERVYSDVDLPEAWTRTEAGRPAVGRGVA